MLMGHILSTYDFKLGEGSHPRMRWFEWKVIPDYSVRMMFRKRA